MSNIINCSITKTGATFNLPTPGNIVFGKETIAKEQRTMNGTMHIDFIASKNTYDISWPYMTYEHLKKLREIIEGTERFFTLKYKIKPNNLSVAEEFSCVVYLKKFEYYPYFYENGFDWKDISITIAEQ